MAFSYLKKNDSQVKVYLQCTLLNFQRMNTLDTLFLQESFYIYDMLFACHMPNPFEKRSILRRSN